MPRYINEDDFCEYIRKNTTPSGAEWFISKIKDMPDADVVEVKHGEWVKSNPLTDTFECSLCGMQIPVPEMCSPFCPLCGADMRGETE